MRFLQLAMLTTALLAAPALAAEDNYNSGAASTSTSTTANCRAAIMLGGCANSVAAPLPALGAGLAGGVLLSAAAGLAAFIRRRRHHGAG